MKDSSSDFARLLAAKRQVTELGGIFYDTKSALLKAAMRAGCEPKISDANSRELPKALQDTGVPHRV